MQTSFYSWVRKGLSGQIVEFDNLGNGSDGVKKRPMVQLTAKLKTVDCVDEDDVSSSEDSKESTKYETKTISLSGPGDVISINANAIVRVFPEPNFSGFPVDDFPYIEFWESDFAWRFTPAKAFGEVSGTANKKEDSRKLRPWLTVVVCKSSECSVYKSSWGTDIVTFKQSSFENVFPLPTDVWKSAHVQVGDDGVEICRILGVRNGKMEENTEYRAFLVPVFEVGRLRGIHGPDFEEAKLNTFVAQEAAWGGNFGEKDSPLTFPSYYSWTFKTGGLSFAAKVKSLKRNDAPKSGIIVDVSSLGEGLDYAILPKAENRRDEICAPAALTTVVGVPEVEFPRNEGGEKQVYENLEALLSKSPVFDENAKEKKNAESSIAVGEDDPWITPPIYGGKHVLATSLMDEDNVNTPWLKQVNLDLHYRTAAGLGKKAVQRNQEELVNRAWQQIDAVKAMNAELCRKMLGANVNDSVKYMNYKWAGSAKTKISTSAEESKLFSKMMMNLSSMRNTSFGKNSLGEDVSLNSILQKKGIPEVFVSDSFRRTAEKSLGNASYPDLMQSIADQQVYTMPGVSKISSISKEELENFASTRIVPYLGKKLIETSDLNIYLSWNGPGPEGKIEVENTRSLATCFNFSNQNTWVNDKRTRWLSSWSCSFYKTLKADSKNEKDAIDYFAKSRMWETPTMGYVSSTIPDIPQNRSSWDIYALDSNVFKSIFFLNDDDNVTVVRVKINNGLVYFIDRDHINDSGNNVTFYWSFVNSELKKMENPSDLIKNVDYFLKLKKKQTFTAQEKWELCAYCVLYTPGSVIASANALSDVIESQGSKYKFENISDLYKTLIENYVKQSHKSDDQNVRLYNAWRNLIKCLDGIELTPDPEKPGYRGCIDDVTILRNGLRDDSQYGRLKECAATYYSAFFSSEKLINDYLDDCLSSKYPIKAYPIFPEPAYYYLKDVADEFILPGINELPDDSISMFKGNAAFIESYLCGMNTEMGRELLWREYPTDQRGSYFKKFWDSATTVEDIKKNNFFDVKSLHLWSGNLGENHMTSKGDLLFFAIKSDLMKLYPDTKITLRKACCTLNNKSLTFNIDKKNMETLEPVSEGFVREGIYVVGFQISFEKALGTPPKGNGLVDESCGYMLVFEKAKENIEFVFRNNNDKPINSSIFAGQHLDTTALVGKHVLTLIGQN